MSKLSNWMEDNVGLLNSPSAELVVKAYNDLPYSDFMKLIPAIIETEILTKEQLLDGYAKVLVQTNEDNKSLFYNNSTSEARLTWIIDQIGHWPTLTYREIKEYIIKNGDKYGLTLKKLPTKYSYSGGEEYDLGWFNPRKYDLNIF